MGKITLTSVEKNNLITNGELEIARIGRNHPKGSVLHGKGIGEVFDKVAYKWAFGDTEDYISKMMNVGRRGEDYKDNKQNSWNGGYWWKLQRVMDDFGTIGSTFVSGRKAPLKFRVDDIYISELIPTDDGKYLRTVFIITLSAE
jgi:hypothetical protein